MSYRLPFKTGKLRCEVIPVTRVRQNCSLVWCDETLRAAVVDPGPDLAPILQAISDCGVEVERLLITHSHPDHAGGAAELAELLQVPIEGPHSAEQSEINRMLALAEQHDFADTRLLEPDRWLADGDSVLLGRCALRVIHCPGHTPGHVVYFEPDSRIAFVGDILFRGTIGATSGHLNHLELLRSIRLKLFPLGDDVTFVPGHGQLSSFGEERLINASVSDLAAEEYEHLLLEPHSSR